MGIRLELWKSLKYSSWWFGDKYLARQCLAQAKGTVSSAYMDRWQDDWRRSGLLLCVVMLQLSCTDMLWQNLPCHLLVTQSQLHWNSVDTDQHNTTLSSIYPSLHCEQTILKHSLLAWDCIFHETKLVWGFIHNTLILLSIFNISWGQKLITKHFAPLLFFLCLSGFPGVNSSVTCKQLFYSQRLFCRALSVFNVDTFI